MRLLEQLGLRKKRDRTIPYSRGEKDFQDWLWMLGEEHGVYEDHVRRGVVADEEKYRDLTKEEKKKRNKGEGVRFKKDKKGKKRALIVKSVGGDECQSDSVSKAAGGSPAKERLKGYVRAAAYPNTTAGKKSADKKGVELARDFEGVLFVQVHNVYCQDIRSHQWTVWVKETGDRDMLDEYWVMEDGKLIKKRRYTQMARIAPRTKKKGGFQEASSRDWGTYRGEAKKKMTCPTCHAPPNFRCVNDPSIYGKGATVKSAEKISIKVLREKRTNAHRSRVDLLLAKKGKKKPAKERRPPTNWEKGSYLWEQLDDQQLEKIEDEDENNSNFTTDDELPFMEKMLTTKQTNKYRKWISKGVLD